MITQFLKVNRQCYCCCIQCPGFSICVPALNPRSSAVFSAMEEVAQDVGEAISDLVNVVVNFLSQLIYIFRLFLGMVMNANEFETKEI